MLLKELKRILALCEGEAPNFTLGYIVTTGALTFSVVSQGAFNTIGIYVPIIDLPSGMIEFHRRGVSQTVFDTTLNTISVFPIEFVESINLIRLTPATRQLYLPENIFLVNPDESYRAAFPKRYGDSLDAWEPQGYTFNGIQFP